MSTKRTDDEASSSKDLDVEEQPFNVNGPADDTGDQEQSKADSQDSSLPGRGLDVEEQPFNVNDPSDPETPA